MYLLESCSLDLVFNVAFVRVFNIVRARFQRKEAVTQQRSRMASGAHYQRASRAWVAARGRVLLQCIAVTTTCQSAARSSDLTTAMRMLWRIAMGFRGAPHSPTRAVRALRPPRGQRWHRSQHHVAANDLARVCGPCWLELRGTSSFTADRG